MKKCQLLKIVVFMLVCCSMVSCGKEYKETIVYGTVVNRWGNPTPNLKVSLSFDLGSPICSTITGSDGQYEFTFDCEGNNKYYDYWIHFGEGGYYDHSSDYYRVRVESGKMNRFDFVR